MQNSNNKSTLKEPFIQKIKGFGKLLLQAGKNFSADKCMKMSASLAYYTVFSIGPLIIIVIWALGILYSSHDNGTTDARNTVLMELNSILGPEISKLIGQTIQQILIEKKSNLGITIGVIVLIVTSTTIFIDVQSSINSIWKIKTKPSKDWIKMVIDRLLSFSMIIILSFLLMLSLLMSSIINLVTNHLSILLSRFNLQDIHIEFWSWINTGITFIVITCLFGCIFAFLPDAKIRFKDILGGAIFTAILFMIGKYGISLYLSVNATATAYGAAGSLIILLAWVYYSAAILYFGAQFTKEYAIKYGKGIIPNSFAVVVEQTEFEIDPQSNTRKIFKENQE